MFSSFKKIIGYTALNESTFGHYEYVSKFIIENKSLKIIKCELSNTTIKLRESNTSQEIQIYSHKTNTKSDYIILNTSISNNSDLVLELLNKSNNTKLTMTIESNSKSIELRLNELSSEGYLFTYIEMINIDKSSMVAELVHNHYLDYVEYKLQFGYPKQSIIQQWKQFAFEDIQFSPLAKSFSDKEIKMAIEDYKTKLE